MGDPKNRRCLIFFIIFVTTIRWEYLHWTNLGLTKLMEVSTFEIDFTKIQKLQIPAFLKPQKPPKKGPAAPTHLFFAQWDPLRAPWGPYRALWAP